MTGPSSELQAESRIGASLVSAALALAGGAALAFWPAQGHAQWKDLLAWSVAGLLDTYLCVLLVLAAMRSDDGAFTARHPRVRRLFPSRSWGLLLVLTMTVALVLAFGRLYQSRPGMFKDPMSPGLALYISFGTLGLNDFGPSCDYGRAVAVFEMFSVLLLVSCVLGLLVSRLSSFVDEAAPAFAAVEPSARPGPWIDVDEGSNRSSRRWRPGGARARRVTPTIR